MNRIAVLEMVLQYDFVMDILDSKEKVMKRKVAESLLLGALSVSVLVGCGSDKEVTKVDDNAVQSTEVSTGADNRTEQSGEEKNSENSGDVLGELVVSSTGYDSIGGMYEDTIVATKDGKWGMVKSDGTVLVPFSYETCQSVDKYDGVTIFVNGEKYYFDADAGDGCYSFDSAGNELSSMYQQARFDMKEWDEAEIADVIYANGLWLWRIDGGIGVVYCDKNGQEIVKIDSSDYSWYDSLHTSGCGIVLTYSDEDGNTAPYYIISKDGFQELDTQGIRPFWTNGKYAWCWDDANGACYLFNISTNELTRISSADSAASYGFCGDMLYIIDEDGMYSFVNVDGTFVTEKKYSYIEGAVESKKYYLVSEGDNWFYIDCEGNEYATDLKDAGVFYDGQAIVLDQNGQAYIIDENFKQVSESVSAAGVASFNKNAYSIQKEDGKYYPVSLK